METLYRLVSGAAAGIAALFAPIGPLVACAVVFIGIDFLSGVAYSINGNLKRVANNTYVITPCNVDVSGDQLKQRPAKTETGDLYNNEI